MIRIYSFPFSRLGLAAIALALVLSACDSSTSLSDDPEAAQLAADEAAEVVASALADTDGGLVASMEDMTAAISHDGMDDSRIVQVGRDRQRDNDTRRHRACRGDHDLTYDDASGTHTVAYECSIESLSFEKSIAATLNYQFRTASEEFIPRPWNDWSIVDSVAFDGAKSGSVKRTRGEASMESSFEQNGAWALSRLSGDGAALLAGRQSREGTRTRVTARGTSTKDFSVTMSSDNIEIRNSDDGLTRSVTGTINYSAVVEIETPTKTETKTVEGTIELDGSGRALLRVFGLGKVYRISLHDGEQEGGETAGVQAAV
ncbi:MAG: hypothetical protein Rubg2KO_33480 [Rubricoccaceae bacterium]